MIIREIEVCPRCGKENPWRVRSKQLVRGELRFYVKCVRCGANEVVVYRQKVRKFIDSIKEIAPRS